MRFGMVVLGLTTLVLTAAPAAAQGRGNGRGNDDRGPDRIPPGHMPAPGMCRVWVDGVPPGRQSPQTDCATARRTAQRNGGRVVYGGDRDDRRDRDGDWRDRDRRDRDDDGWWRNDDRHRSGGEWCRDSDRDGTCDYAESRTRRDDSPWRFPSRRDDACVDRNRDGRCDDWRPSGSTSRISLPSGRPRMSAALDFDRGVRSSEVISWVGRDVHDVKITRFLNRPVAATFYDRTGRILQRWKKVDDQGRMREIEVYERGQLVRTVER